MKIISNLATKALTFFCLSIVISVISSDIVLANPIQKAYLVLTEDLGLTSKNIHWKRLCKNLKKSNKTSGYSYAYFAKVRCVGKKMNKSRLFWQVSFKKKSSKVLLVISVHRGKYSQILREFFVESGETDEKLIKSLDASALLDLIRLYTPYLGRVKIKKKQENIYLPEDIKEDLFLFKLDFDQSKGFQARIYGKSIQTGETFTKRGKTYYKYQLSPLFYPQHSSYFLASLSSLDPEFRLKEEKRLLPKLANRGVKLFIFHLSSLKPSFSGVRYGVSMVKDSELFARSANVAALVEVRDGFASGLRFYYESSPEVELERDGIIEKFGWNRYSLAYGISFKNSLFFTDLITTADIVTKTGSFSLDTSINNLPITVENSLSFGLELGLEHRNQWFRGRGWLGIDSTTGIDNGSTSVSSTKVGMDLSFKLASFNRTQLDLLLFSNSDKLNISSLDVSSDSTSRISYRVVYAGAGILVGW